MNEFNTYLKNLDYSHVKDLCVEKGLTVRKISLSVRMK